MPSHFRNKKAFSAKKKNSREMVKFLQQGKGDWAVVSIGGLPHFPPSMKDHLNLCCRENIRLYATHLKTLYFSYNLTTAIDVVLTLGSTFYSSLCHIKQSSFSEPECRFSLGLSFWQKLVTLIISPHLILLCVIVMRAFFPLLKRIPRAVAEQHVNMRFFITIVKKNKLATKVPPWGQSERWLI